MGKGMGEDFLDEECCPNCGHFTDGEDICPNCGAILKHDDDFGDFEESDGSLDDDL